MPQTPANSFADRDRERDRVRDATDIVRLVGEHVALRPKGREFVGLCPFHEDHSPSMYVVPAKQIFHCFVCGAGGDAFSFVQKLHKMEFPEAIKYLAERAGIELAPWKPGGQRGIESDESDGGGRSSRRELFAANAAACDFFRAVLRHPEHGAAAREVIQRRGIRPEMVEAFGLGASPDRWDGLLLTIQGKGLAMRHFEQAGLLKRRGDGETEFPGAGGGYDALRHRLIFPIHDATGRVIAFGGRKIRDEDEPKYLNSPETPLFQKASTLYGLFQAHKSIGQQRTAIVTEGYTDTIACHQAGITNVVATLGTALTARHARVLERYCDSIVLLFDGDSAGEKAAERAVEVLFGSDVDVRIATLAGRTDAKDPDELLRREGGIEVLRTAIAQARPLLSFRYERLRDRLQGPALTRRFDEEIQTLARLGYASLRPEKRRVIQRQLATTWNVSEGVIADRFRAKGAGTGEPNTRGPAPARSRPANLEILIGCVLADEALWAELPEQERSRLAEAGDADDAAPVRSRVARAMIAVVDSGERCSLVTLADRLEDPDDRAWAIGLEEWVRRECEGNEERIDRLRRDCLAHLTRSVTALSPLEALRQQHRTWGPNRAVLPRPASP
jgi:DNA primase